MIDTPITGFSIVYGVSDNDRAPVDNSGARHLGFRPKDNVEKFAEEIYSNSSPLDPKNLNIIYMVALLQAFPWEKLL